MAVLGSRSEVLSGGLGIAKITKIPSNPETEYGIALKSGGPKDQVSKLIALQ